MGGGYDIGLSSSLALSSQSGAAQSGTGDFSPTFGGRGALASILPTASGSQAWIVWLIAGAVALGGIYLWRRA